MPRPKRAAPKRKNAVPAVAERMAELYGDLLAKHYRERSEVLSYRKFGLLVAKAHPKERHYEQSTVATWVKYGQRPDDAETQQAIADVFGVSPGWLWFGAGPRELTASVPRSEGVIIGRSRPKQKQRRSA